MNSGNSSSEADASQPAPKWCTICGSEEPYDESGMCWSCIGRTRDEVMDSGTQNLPVLVVASLLALSGFLAVAQGMSFYSMDEGDLLLFGHNVGSVQVWGIWCILLGMLILASAGSSLKRKSSLTPFAGSVMSILAIGFFAGAIVGVIALVLTIAFNDRFG